MAIADLKLQIHTWVEAHREEILRLTEDLIRYPSENRMPTGAEADCQLFVAETLRAMGLSVDVFDPTDVPELTQHEVYWPGRAYHNRPNVIGVWRGAGGGQSLLFTSHVDVVVGSAGGHFNPFEPVREGDRLYGRGACDMKGGLAATMIAVRCLQELGVRLRGDVLIESIVDEENAGSNGTLAARLRGYNADAALCPEPNNMVISPAHRGGCMWEIIIEGKPGVPFSANEIVNPAYAVAHLAVAIETWEQERNQRLAPPPLFAATPGLAVLVSILEATGNGVSVPATGRLQVWAEAYPGMTYQELHDDLFGHLQEVIARTPVLAQAKVTVKQIMRFLPGSGIARAHAMIGVLERTCAEVLGEPAPVQAARFACDAFVFNLHSPTPCIILGPRGGNAHIADEWVLQDDLLNLTKIYALAALDWCGVSDA